MNRNYHRLAYCGRFSVCLSVVYIQYTPSSQTKNRSALCDPAVNIYCRTGSKIAGSCVTKHFSQIIVELFKKFVASLKLLPYFCIAIITKAETNDTILRILLFLLLFRKKLKRDEARVKLLNKSSLRHHRKSRSFNKVGTLVL